MTAFGIIYIILICDRIQLCAPPTMITVDYDRTSFYREGFILSLYLEDGSVGYGEVSFVLMLAFQKNICLTSLHNCMATHSSFFFPFFDLFCSF